MDILAHVDFVTVELPGNHIRNLLRSDSAFEGHLSSLVYFRRVVYSEHILAFAFTRAFFWIMLDVAFVVDVLLHGHLGFVSCLDHNTRKVKNLHITSLWKSSTCLICVQVAAATRT